MQFSRARALPSGEACGEQDGFEWSRKYVWTKKGPGGQQQLREVDPAQAYGHRPARADIWYLSPYEFTMYWDVVPMRVPSTRAEWEAKTDVQWDVTVTAKGEAKLRAAKSGDARVRLVPGTDFRKKADEESASRAFFGVSAGNALRHGWQLRRKLRPMCPHLAHAPGPDKSGGDVDRNAKLTLAYFRAWTLDKRRGSAAVPYIADLREVGESWEQSLRNWLLRCMWETSWQSIAFVRPTSWTTATTRTTTRSCW